MRVRVVASRLGEASAWDLLGPGAAIRNAGCVLWPFSDTCQKAAQERFRRIIGAGTPEGGTPGTTLRNIPTWCDSVPYSDWFDVCQPYSREEIERDTAASLEKIRKVNPVLADQAAERIRQIDAAEAKSGARRDLEAYWSNPYLSKVFGTGTVATVKESLEKIRKVAAASDYAPLIVAGVGLAAALVLLKRR